MNKIAKVLDLVLFDGTYSGFMVGTAETVGLAAHILPLSACTLNPTKTRGLHRHIGPSPGYVKPLLRDSRQFVLAVSLQAFVIAAYAPDIVGALT